MVIEKFENQQIDSPAVSTAVSVSELRPGLPNACSKVTPSDSHTTRVYRGPPTETTSDSSSASVPLSFTRLPASSLTTASCTMGRSGELISKGTVTSGLLRNRQHDDCSRLRGQFLLSFFFHQA